MKNWLDKYKQVDDLPKAQKGLNIPGVTDFKAPRAASESTSRMMFNPVTKKMVSTATTGQNKKDVAAATKDMGKAKKTEREEERKRVAERKSAVAAKDKGSAFKLPSGETKKYSDMSAREKMYVSGKALEQRGRFNEDKEAWYDDFANPINWITSAAGALGTAPYEAQQSGSVMPYVSAIANPLMIGAGGFDPLGSAMKIPSKVAQSMESGLLSKVHKLNPNLQNPLGFKNVGDVPHIWKGYTKQVNPETIDLTSGFSEYQKSLNKHSKKLKTMLEKNKISKSDASKLYDEYSKNLKKKTPFGEKIGSGAFGEVYEFANNPDYVLKYGMPSFKEISPEFISGISEFNKYGNIAVPLKASSFKDVGGLGKKQISLMRNLNKTKSILPSNLSQRDAYALFLKQARQLKDKGVMIDLEGPNVVFNKNKGIYDIYDLENFTNRIKNDPTYIKAVNSTIRKRNDIPENSINKEILEQKEGGLIKAQTGLNIPGVTDFKMPRATSESTSAGVVDRKASANYAAQKGNEAERFIQDYQKKYPGMSREQANFAFNASKKSVENQGQIKKAGPKRSAASKAMAIATNPMTALKYKVKGQDIPENFERGERNRLDMAVDVVNPFSYAQAAKDVKSGVSDGNYTQAGLGLLNFIPGKFFGKAASKLDDLAGIKPKSVDKVYPSGRTAFEPFGPRNYTAEEFRNVQHINELTPEQINQNYKSIQSRLQGIRDKGKYWDEIGAKGSELLNDDMIHYHGTYDGRPIVEVKMPDGTSQHFYKSTGWAEKKGAGAAGTTEDMWQVYGEHNLNFEPEYITRNGVRIKNPNAGKATKNWFIKGPDYDSWYGSNTFRDMSGGLDFALSKKYGVSADELPIFLNQKNISHNVDTYTPQYRRGGIITDSRGQWAHPGKVTRINSPYITMQGVPYPVLGVSDTGDTQMMYPGQEYEYDGNSVTEFPMMKKGGELCRDDKGNVVPCDEQRLSELGSDAYTAMAPFYETLYGAANKYKNERTGKVSDLNSARATAKAFLKHPNVVFMKRHSIPSELTDMEHNPYAVQSYTTPIHGGWYPTQWAEPREERENSFGDWWKENIKYPYEEWNNRRKTRKGIRRQGRCFGANCTEDEMQDQAEYGGDISIPNLQSSVSMYKNGGSWLNKYK
jgi:hypothetical protein